jgi:hypothetical protein
VLFFIFFWREDGGQNLVNGRWGVCVAVGVTAKIAKKLLLCLAALRSDLSWI